MRKRLILIALTAFIVHPSYRAACADYPSQSRQEGRYEMLIPEVPNGYGARTTYRKVPAIVLDTWQGIAWRCTNLEDEKPVWVKDELDKDAPASSTKKYSGRISNMSGPELRISALIINTEEGRAWNCPDITQQDAKWTLTDLTKAAPKKKDMYSEE
ncbi:MAG: hypothetical protein NTU54_06240 [Candidatus Omnitrophica bacterium]|nr:hypothetical protein [Candidatus Omnitrophota bacterium]